MSSDIIEEALPYIPPDATVETDAEGGKTYHFSLGEYVHKVYISKDSSRIIQETSVMENGQELKSSRKETLNNLKDGVQEIYFDGKLGGREEYKAGKKHGISETYYSDGNLWICEQYKDGIKDGIRETYSSDGKLQGREEYKAGVKNGIQETYYLNGKLEKREEYKNGIKHGCFESYDLRFELERIGKYVNGKKEGKWKYFMGNSCTEIFYSNGKYNGLYESYEKIDGKKVLSERKHYVNGNISGICEIFLAGELNEKISYVDGKKDGPYIRYLGDSPSVVGSYSKGKKTGKWTFYLLGDLVCEIQNYKNGKRHGLWQKSHFRGSKIYGLEIDHVIETNYVNDLMDGEFPYREFDKDGNLILEGSLIKKKKEGVWNHYKNNKLISQDFYEKGNLVATIQSNIPPVDNEVKEVKKIPSEVRKMEVSTFDDIDIICKYETINGTKDGLYQVFDCNDHLREEGYYRDGKKVGIWKSYNEEGFLWRETPYDDGKVFGIIKEYMDDELRKRIFVSGKEEPEICAYERYRNGEISEQGEYTARYLYDSFDIRNEKVIQKFWYGKPEDPLAH